jgi:AhpD family alkylhydroperoxidase
MKNPAMIVPDAMTALVSLGTAAKAGPVPVRTLNLVYLRASQINGCSLCVDLHARDAKKAGDSDERLLAVAAWRDTTWFTPAERAALELTEAITRVSDRPDPVPDALWEQAARHYEEPALANLLLNIALINFWNRTNIPTRQVAGPR